MDRQNHMVLKPKKDPNLSDEDVDIMKDYMIRMGRQLNGIKGKDTGQKPKIKNSMVTYRPHYMRKELWSKNGLPLFYQALDLVNAKQKKKTWHTYKRGRKRHGLYRK